MSATQTALTITLGAILGSAFSSSLSLANKSIDGLSANVNKIKSTHIDIKAFKKLKDEGKESSEEFTNLANKLKNAGIDTTNLDAHIKGLAGNLNHLRKQAKIDIKISSNFDLIKKEISGLKGLFASSLAITGFANIALDLEQAKGEIQSLGIAEAGIEKIALAGKKFSNEFAGTTASDFIRASYDIKSGISSLTDDGVANFTRLAALTGTATKSSTEEMTKTFALGYGVFREQFNTDEEFGEKFATAVSSAVRGFRTTGSDLSGSISALGAIAVSKGVSMVDQFATIGVLKDTFNSASEAATGFKGFLNGVGGAQDALGLNFTDSAGKMLPVVEVLELIKEKYGDSLETVETQDLFKKAFGSDEAVKMIGGTINKIDQLKDAQNTLNDDIANGTTTLEEMANAMQRGKSLLLFKQQVQNLSISLGSIFLPVLKDVFGTITKGLDIFNNFLENNDKLSSAFRFLGNVLGYLTVGLVVLVGAYKIANIITTGLAIAKLYLTKISYILGVATNANTIKSIALTKALSIKTFMINASNRATKAYAFTSAIFSGVLSKMRLALTFTTGAFRIMGLAMMSNPIGLVLGGIALAAGLIIANWDAVKVYIKSFVDWIYPIFEPVITFYKTLWGGIFDFLGINFEWLAEKFTWVTEKATSLGKFFGFGADEELSETTKEPTINSINGLAGNIDYSNMLFNDVAIPNIEKEILYNNNLPKEPTINSINGLAGNIDYSNALKLPEKNSIFNKTNDGYFNENKENHIENIKATKSAAATSNQNAPINITFTGSFIVNQQNGEFDVKELRNSIIRELENIKWHNEKRAFI